MAVIVSSGLNQKHPRGSHGGLAWFVYRRPTNTPHRLLCSPCVYNYTVQTRTSKETIEKLIQCRDNPLQRCRENGEILFTEQNNHKGEMELNERLIIIKRPPALCKVVGDPPIAEQRLDRRAALLVGNLSGWRDCSGYCREQNGINSTSPRVSKQPDKGQEHMQEREAGDQTWRIGDVAQQLQLEVKKHTKIRPLAGAKN